MRIKLLGASALLSMVAVGCGPPSAEDVAGAVRKTVVQTTAQASNSAGTLEGMTLLGDLGTVGSTGLMPRDALPPMMPDLTLPGLKLPDTAMQKLLPNHDDAEVAAAGERVAIFLETRVFTEENVEERTGDAIIFRVTGEDLCTDGTYEPDPGCISSVDQYEIRFRATRPDNSILVTLLLGPDRDEPFSVQMSKEFVAFSTNLAEVRASVLYVSSVTGAEATGLPSVMEGILEVRAAKGEGEHDFTLSQSILAAVKVEYAYGDAQYALNVAARSNITRVQFIEAERRLRVDLDLPQVDYAFPMYFYTYDEATGVWSDTSAPASARLGGASFSFDTREGATELLVTHIGLGDVTTTLHVDGVQVYGVDLNATSGRHFDLHLHRDTSSRPVFQVRSHLQVDVTIDHSPMVAHGQTVDAWAVQDHMSVSFTGGSGGPSYQHQPYDAVSGFPGGERVIAGTLVLTTDEPGVAPVTVTEGQCLVSEYQYDEAGNAVEGHPFAVVYSARACQ